MAYPNPLSGIARTVSGFSTPLNVASLLPGGNTSGLAPNAETLAKVMGGDLSGTMSTSDKLMALGALLRSAAPGSQMLPQQVMAQIKQQKIADLQNKLAIEQARKAATEEANLNAAWETYVASRPVSEQAGLRAFSRAKREDVLQEQYKYRKPDYSGTAQMAMEALDPTLPPEVRDAVRQKLQQGDWSIQNGQIVYKPGIAFGNGDSVNPGNGAETKTLNGVTYVRVNGAWYSTPK